MYLRIGGVLRPFNEVKAPSIGYRIIYDARRIAMAIEETWQLSGRIVLQTNASQTAMTLAIQKLFADLSQPTPDLVFVEDSGAKESALAIKAEWCYEGPNLIDVSMPSDAQDVYATGMTWQAVYSAKRKLIGVGNPVVSFQESLANPQGGLVLGMVGGAINLPELQVFQANAFYHYIQSGSVVGMFGYIEPPPPLFPAFQVRRNKPVYQSPRNHGPIPTEFETSYEYEFMSQFPLIGIPHQLPY